MYLIIVFYQDQKQVFMFNHLLIVKIVLMIQGYIEMMLCKYFYEVFKSPFLSFLTAAAPAQHSACNEM